MTIEKKIVHRSYLLGGMGNADSQQEVAWVLSQIDGVQHARVENSNVLKVAYDENSVLEDHLKSTLMSLGHSILEQ